MSVLSEAIAGRDSDIADITSRFVAHGLDPDAAAQLAVKTVDDGIEILQGRRIGESREAWRQRTGRA